ncbi:MAG TPA: DUF3795 domain-containing protein [Dehalococcoidia bacterium]|nr:DUF3795 domain-containing protein [Dehalococcoidia bacterium]
MAEGEQMLAYCGLYCGECVMYQGEIADMARDLRKKLREAKFDRVAAGIAQVAPFFKEFNNYPVCYEVLGAMVKLRCRHSCKQGGGNPSCKVRLCCTKKKVAGCWECADFESCSKLDFLTPIHGDAVYKNMRKIKKSGMEAFLAGEKYW